MKSKLLLFFFLVSFTVIAYAQQAAYSDAAQAYNKLLIEKSNNSYTRIDNYKVVGSPYLFGGKNRGNLFARKEFAYDINLSYNTYNNEIEFYSSSNPSKSLIKDFEMVDSFILKQNLNSGINENIKFVSSKILNAKEKGFYQIMYVGEDFDLYKKYNSTLGIVTTNYIQSELRQFDLSYEYYYLNKSTKELKKIKLTRSGLKKEFKSIKDISPVLDNKNLGANPDLILNAIFVFLNN